MELPKDIIVAILRRTTPLDVARLSAISKTFRSAADSDIIWDHFLPFNYNSIISESPFHSNAPSKKALYLALSDRPSIIDQGEKSFQLEKKTGKKCYMLSAITLKFIRVRGDDHWMNFPESRFESCKHISEGWFHIRGKINNVVLSSNTQYAAFLVFKLTDSCELLYSHVVLSVSITGSITSSRKTFHDPRVDERLLDSRIQGLECPSVRSDGLLEIELGEFFNSDLDDYEMKIKVTKIKLNCWFDDFYLEGIEVRPKVSDH